MGGYIYIKDCSECKKSITYRTATGDSFDVAWDYYCKHPDIGERKIEGYVCWNEKLGKIPDWCPIKLKN